jgi:hypothetical protein
MKGEKMGKLILGFIYYILLGFGSLMYKILGINPFARKLENGSYWTKKQYGGDGKGYRIAKPPETNAASSCG